MNRKWISAVALIFLTMAPMSSALQTEEVLDLVAMPLAVAAAAEITGVPAGDLARIVTALNDTDVPPAQFVEVVRYIPVLLVDPTTGPQVVTFVTNEVDRGITSPELVLALQDRIRAAGIDQISINDSPRRVLDRSRIVPDIVVERADAVRRNHPHGGPPGQLKKEVGAQTGAEIVHGTNPGVDRDSVRIPADRDPRANEQGRDRQGPPPHAGQNKPDPSGKAKGKGQGRGQDDKNRGQGNSDRGDDGNRGVR